MTDLLALGAPESWILLAASLSLGVALLGEVVAPGHRLNRSLFQGATVLLLVALGLMLAYFLYGHLGVDYVYTYSRLDYPWYYRLAGLWAGQKGTLQIWTAFTAAFGWLLLRKTERAIAANVLPSEPTQRFLETFRRVLLLIVFLLSLTLLIGRTFEATNGYFLAVRPDGNGLQPVLLTPFMVIHPPIQFLVYALIGVIFAAAVAHVATGQYVYAPITLPWLRLAWMLATLGLGLGGLWAYYVLNFGGYWAWDPVETANLIVWFPLTLLLHAFLHHREGRHRVLAALFGLLTLPAALFSTVATRTGLWIQGVHAFTDPSKDFAKDPLLRLLNILETGALVRYLTGLLFATLLLAFAAVVWNRASTSTRGRALRPAIAAVTALGVAWLLLDTVGSLSLLFQASHLVSFGRSAPAGLAALILLPVGAVVLTSPEPAHAEPPPHGEGRLHRWINSRTVFTTGLVLLSLAFLVLLLLNLASINGYGRAPYDARAPLMAYPILLVLSGMFLLPRWGPRRAVQLCAAAALLGLGGALAGHRSLFLVLPPLLLAGAAAFLRVLDLTGSGPHARAPDKRAGAALLVGAVAAFVQWANPPSRIDLVLTTVNPDWPWAVPMYALAAFALAVGALHRSRPQPRLARLAAVSLLPTFGFGVATLCGLLALLFLARSSPATTPLGLAFQERRPSLRKASIYLLHFSLVLGLLGYAFSTYESDQTNSLPVSSGGSPAFETYTFSIVASRAVGFDPVQELPEQVHTELAVHREGRDVGHVTLVYWLVHDGTPGHYDARVAVLRRATEDVYVFPKVVNTTTGNLTDHVNNARPAVEPGVAFVEVSVKVLPGMALVWTGLWLLVLSMAANLLLGGFQTAPQRGATPPGPKALSDPPALTNPGLE